MTLEALILYFEQPNVALDTEDMAWPVGQLNARLLGSLAEPEVKTGVEYPSYLPLLTVTTELASMLALQATIKQCWHLYSV